MTFLKDCIKKIIKKGQNFDLIAMCALSVVNLKKLYSIVPVLYSIVWAHNTEGLELDSVHVPVPKLKPTSGFALKRGGPQHYYTVDQVPVPVKRRLIK